MSDAPDPPVPAFRPWVAGQEVAIVDDDAIPSLADFALRMPVLPPHSGAPARPQTQLTPVNAPPSRAGTGRASSARPQLRVNTHTTIYPPGATSTTTRNTLNGAPHGHPAIIPFDYRPPSSYNPITSQTPSMPTATQSTSPYGHPTPFSTAAPAFVPYTSSHGRGLPPYPAPHPSRGARHGPRASTFQAADQGMDPSPFVQAVTASHQRIVERQISQQQHDGPPSRPSPHIHDSAFTEGTLSGQQRGHSNPTLSVIRGSQPFPHHRRRPALDHSSEVQVREALLAEARLAVQTARTAQNRLPQPQREPLMEIPDFAGDSRAQPRPGTAVDTLRRPRRLVIEPRDQQYSVSLDTLQGRIERLEAMSAYADQVWEAPYPARVPPAESAATVLTEEERAHYRQRLNRRYPRIGDMTDAELASLGIDPSSIRRTNRALPRDYVSTLPRVPLSSLENNQHDQSCDLCTDRYEYLDEGREPEDAVRLPCNHVFGHNCLKRWFNQQNDNRIPNTTCPMCRQQLGPAQSRTVSRQTAPQEPVGRAPQGHPTLHRGQPQMPQQPSFSFSETFLSQSSQGSPEGQATSQTRTVSPRAPQGSPQNGSSFPRATGPPAVLVGRRPSEQYAAYVAWVQQRRARGDNVDLDDEWIAMGLDGRLAQAPPRQGPGFAAYRQSMRARATDRNGQPILPRERDSNNPVPDSEITGDYDDDDDDELIEGDDDDLDDSDEEDDEDEEDEEQ